MACRWRIRHKLMIGFGLVVGIIALLLTGTLHGLASYRASIGSYESKINEKAAAEKLNVAVDRLGSANEDSKQDRLRRDASRAREELKHYEARLQETLDKNRDPDRAYDESGLVLKLAQQFDCLNNALDADRIHLDGPGDGVVAVRDTEPVQAAIQNLKRTSGDLQDAINLNLGRRNDEARKAQRNTTILVIATSILGVLLLGCLLRGFYRWVYFPVRDLQLGAARVALGDFEHRINVHSGDELEDLATAFNDMTARLQMIYADLARQVNERSRQLVRSERLASVGFLAAGVAHEINNPLASIAFCSEALQARIADLLKKRGEHGGLRVVRGDEPAGDRSEDMEVITRYLNMIQEESFRCKEITSRLLEFSRGGEKRREPVELAGLVQSVLDVVQHLQNGKGKEITFEHAAPVEAWVNGQEIKSVVLNLVVNALDSMEDGGRLSIRLGKRDSMAVLEFSDTGCGMTTEVLDNIFEPFFTRSRTGKGTGLGLTICHRVITQHGGEIEATSAGPEQGSTFTVRLPLQPVETAREEPLGHAA